MKKQKPPVILGSFLVVLLAGVFIMTWKGSGAADDGHNPEQEAPKDISEMPITGESRNKMSKDDIVKQVKQSKTGKSKNEGETERGNPMDEAMMKPAKPTIYLEDFSAAKPTPNETATSSQWWKDEWKGEKK